MRRFLLCAIALLCAIPALAQLAEPNERGIAFGHVHLTVADRDLHKRLWTDLFDAVLVEKEGYAAVRVPGALVFFTEGEPTAPSINTGMDHVGFLVRNVEEIVTKWRALGYEVDSEKTDAGGSRVAYLTMPGGVRLELREQPELAVGAVMDHVHFMSPAPRQLMDWYAEVIGVTVPVSEIVSPSGEVPGSGLRFGRSGGERAHTDGTAIDHIGFEIENWDMYIERLSGNGIEFEFGPVYIESLDLWVAFFTDPSGVLVEVTHGLDHF